MFISANVFLLEDLMSIIDPTLPVLLASTTADHTEEVLTKLHKEIASALRDYNRHIAWLTHQLSEGNISHSMLLGIVCKPVHQHSHQSPISIAINERYIDPTMASIVDNIKTTLPNHLIHITAKLLTMHQIDLDAFPPVCHEEEASPSITIS